MNDTIITNISNNKNISNKEHDNLIFLGWKQYKIWYISGDVDYFRVVYDIENKIKNIVIEESELKKILAYYNKYKKYIAFEKDDFILSLKVDNITTYEKFLKIYDSMIQHERFLNEEGRFQNNRKIDSVIKLEMCYLE